VCGLVERQDLGPRRTQRGRLTGRPFQLSGSRDDYDRPGIERREQARRWRDLQPAIVHDPGERPLAEADPRRQHRIVDQHRRGAHGDGIRLGTVAVYPTIAGVPRQACTSAPASGDSPVQADGDLHRDPRPAAENDAEVRLVQLASFRREDS
jgi:hypothetical protein